MTTREVHDAESDPLLRMPPGYERYKRILLLYETCLADTGSALLKWHHDSVLSRKVPGVG